MEDYSKYVGRKYGRLKIISLTEDYISPQGVHQPMVVCKCDCGNVKTINLRNIIQGKTKSCGCLIREKRAKSLFSPSNNARLYYIHNSMIARCYRTRAINYNRYGGKGINVCSEWRGKNGRKNFMQWALNNGYESSLTLDRKDNTKGYSPENCRWVDVFTQANNKSNNRKIEIDGVAHTLAEWSRISGIKADTIWARINCSGYSNKEAVFNPLYSRRSKQAD